MPPSDPLPPPETEAPKAPDTLEAVRQDLACVAAVVSDLIKAVERLENWQRTCARQAQDFHDRYVAGLDRIVAEADAKPSVTP